MRTMFSISIGKNITQLVTQEILFGLPMRSQIRIPVCRKVK